MFCFLLRLTTPPLGESEAVCVSFYYRSHGDTNTTLELRGINDKVLWATKLQTVDADTEWHHVIGTVNPLSTNHTVSIPVCNIIM